MPRAFNGNGSGDEYAEPYVAPPPTLPPPMPAWKETLLWIAVIPAAIAAYIAIQIVVAIGNSFSPGSESFVNAWCQFVNSVAGPYCFVIAGAKTAPAHRFITAVVLTVLFALFSGALLTLAFEHSARLSTPLWWLTTSSIIGIVASIVACVQFHHGEPSFE